MLLLSVCCMTDNPERNFTAFSDVTHIPDLNFLHMALENKTKQNTDGIVR